MVDTNVDTNGARMVQLGGVCRVDAPWAEVYFVRTGTEGEPEERLYLGTLRRGALCCGGDRSGGRLILRLPNGGRGGIATADLGRRAAVRAVLPWISMLAAAPLKGPLPRVVQEALPGRSATLPEGTVLRASNEPAWLQVSEGGVYLYGRRSRTALLGEGLWPLAPHQWVVLRDTSTVTISSTMAVFEDGSMAESVRRFTGLTLALMAQDSGTRAAVEARRLAEREAADHRLVQATFVELLSLFDTSLEGTSDEDPLLSAVRQVAADEGIEITSVPRNPPPRLRARLREVGRSNGFRMRRLALRGRWWRLGGMAMLGSWMPGHGETPRPVAIRPVRHGRGYVVSDPSDGTSVTVDEDVSSRLSPFAYAFYRPMPTNTARMWELARFGLRGCGQDMRRVAILGFLAGGLAAATPVLTGKVFDVAIPEADVGNLYQITALLAGVAVTAALFQLVRALALLRIETRIDASVQSGIWDHLLALPADFFRKYSAGDLAMRAGGVGIIRQQVSGAATTALLTGVFACWYLALMFYYDARLAAWVSAGVVVATAASVSLAVFQLRHMRRATLVQSRLSGLVLQLVTGIAKLRVAGAEIRAFSRWATRFAAQRREYVLARRYGNALDSMQAVVPLLMLMLVYGLFDAMAPGALSTGSFLAFHTALLSFVGAATMVTTVFKAAASAMPYYEQLEPILRCARETDSQRIDPGEISGDVEVRHVTFRYGGDGPPVLDNVSIHARPGEFIALVGPSGSGKSSLLRLLLGFEAPDAGSIYFDGQDAAGLDQHALRRQFGVVLQEAGMLTGDILTNIIGSSDASMDDAWEAARMAGLAEEIKAMPMGMHTVINQSGTTISGGQRQRLMVARAIVTRPRLLLFDEATSALDNVTQEHVSRSLEALHATRAVVAHRLTTIMHADRIYVLDRGRVVEQGSYADLMQLNGLFARLARRQLVMAG